MTDNNKRFVAGSVIAVLLLLLTRKSKAANSFSSNSQSSPAPLFNFPVQGSITSGYGQRANPLTGKKDFHNGIDIAADIGTEVKAPASGTIAQIYTNDLGGLQMIVKHDNGYFTGYAHLSDTVKNVGDTVQAGDVIAHTGQSGEATGPHLHFTIFHKDENNKTVFVDPQTLLS